jgi:hypothetical protein
MGGLRLQGLTVALLVGAVLAVCVSGAAATGIGGPPGVRFVNFEFAAAPVGTDCPMKPGPEIDSNACWNHAVEPAIRADRDGTFYVASENTLFKGTIAAKSTDGGLHFSSLPSPNEVSGGNAPGFAPGGGDVDVATAPDKNPAGFYNVYVASLTLANVSVSTSKDGGARWSLNPAAAQIEGDDREWIAADGASKVCISYHDLVTFNINVDCSFDAGATFTQHAVPGAIDAEHAFLLQNNQIGNLAIDAASHVIYQPLTGIAGWHEFACGFANICRYHVLWMAVSTDGGKKFKDYPVYVGPSDQVGLNHMFPNVTIDRAGNVYVLWSDDHNVYYSRSTNRGRTWSRPVRVNGPPARTAIFPWAVAGDRGKLDVVYYGTDYYDESTPPDRYPASTAWYAYFAQDLNAADLRSDFKQVRASPVVHYGAVCEMGAGCTGNRDLFDDFGVAASPTTGLASIAYTIDQYRPSGQPECTPARSNTFDCDHTAIATQTSGPGIFGVSKDK